MISNQLLEKINLLDKNLKEKLIDFTETERTYARAIKLNEEVWELMSLVLSHFWDVRKEKLEKHKQEDLLWEFADVIITTLMLAKSMNIDINEALNYKLNIIKNRWWI